MSETTIIKAPKAALPYYSFDKLFSFNAVYNFLIGARGLGKTYGAKKYVIKNAIRNEEQFIYIRRYKTELFGRMTFFADIAHEFPLYDFRVDGSRAQMALVSTRGERKRHWTTIGYFIALSNAQAQKSVAYPLVTTIIFDEFIIEKGALHYLPNEARAFNDFYSTVDRWKDKTRVLFLANGLSITNPYFLEYNILPDNKAPEEFMRKAGGFVVAHFADSAEFATGVFKTRFGQFIQDTEYAEYSVNSRFADNHERLIAVKSAKAKYYCTIETKTGAFSVWIDWGLPEFFIQEKRPKQENIYTIVPGQMENGKRLLDYTDKIMQYLRAGFSNGRLYFDTPKARNAFIEIFRR